MSKKNLLNESQVRQFMKLANLEPLSPGFVHGLTERAATEEMEESHGRSKFEGAGGPADQNTRNEGLEDDLEDSQDEVEMDVEDLGAEDELADEEGDEVDDLEGELDVADDELADEGGRMVSVDDFLEALESALETAIGDEVEVDASEMSDEVEDEEAPEADVEMDAELDMGDEDVEGDDELEDELMDEGFAGPSVTDDDRVAWEAEMDAKEGPEARKARATANPASTSRERMRARRGRDHGSTGMKIGGITAEGQTELVEQVTKRVAARILKAALAKK